MGRRHQPFYRICAVDSRAPRDGKVIEELGHYDPLVKETDARAILKGDRVAYWLGVGAKPSERVATLIRKYGSQGTHLEKQRLALERLKLNRPQAPPPMVVPRKKKEEPQPEPPAAEVAEAAPAAAAGESGAAE
jgi:small subunit ribosomal protein S16